MKIIGTTNGSYITEITEDEIAILLGFRGIYDDAYKGWKSTIRHTLALGGSLPVGMSIQVREIAQFWQAILWKEEEAKKAASTLRALADLITISLPSGLVPPPAQPQEEAES